MSQNMALVSNDHQYRQVLLFLSPAEGGIASVNARSVKLCIVFSPSSLSFFIFLTFFFFTPLGFFIHFTESQMTKPMFLHCFNQVVICDFKNDIFTQHILILVNHQCFLTHHLVAPDMENCWLQTVWHYSLSWHKA